MDHVICHFEIPADNVETLAGFYSELFGWKIAPLPGMGDYWGIRTSEDPKAVGGGMIARQHSMHMPTNYVMVEDVAAFCDKAVGMGATVAVPKTAIPNLGWFALLVDPQGNCFGLFESA